MCNLLDDAVKYIRLARTEAVKVDKVIVCCQRSSCEAFLSRDWYLVYGVSCTRDTGGTAYTLHYA